MRRQAAAIAALLLATSGTLAARSSTSPALGFGVPRIVDPASNGGEPSIAFDSRGRLHVSSIGPAFGNSGPMWEVSNDGGHTFQALSRLAGVELNPYTSGQRTETGDTHLGTDAHGRTYFSMTSNSSCGQNVRTDDGGATRTASAGGACALPAGADRQWFVVFDPPKGRSRSPYAGPLPLVYQTHKTALVLGPTWSMSNDGTLFRPATAGNPVTFRPLGDSFPRPVMDESTGQVLTVVTNFDARNDGAADAVGTNTYLNIGKPDATGALTWLDEPDNDVSRLIPVLKGRTASHIKTMGMDRARNLYLAYTLDLTGDYTLYITASTAASGWRDWSRPVRVSSRATRTNVWPILVGGAPGHVGIAWYATAKGTPEADARQLWYLEYAHVSYPTSRSGRIRGRPHIEVQPAVGHPVHRGGLCVNGVNCSLPGGTNRSFADFLDITADRDGRPVIAYNDDIDVPADPSGVSAYAPVFVVTQTSGASLDGRRLRPTAADDFGRPAPGRFPVAHGPVVPGLSVDAVSLRLAGDRAVVDIAVPDLRDPAGTAAAAGNARLLRYIARWRVGLQTYFAGVDVDVIAGTTTGYGGMPGYPVQYSQAYIRNYGVGTVYADSSPNGSGRVVCPARPSSRQPCHVLVSVPAASVGHLHAGLGVTELGAWAMAAAAPQGTPLDHVEDRNKPILLVVGGTCCGSVRLTEVRS